MKKQPSTPRYDQKVQRVIQNQVDNVIKQVEEKKMRIDTLSQQISEQENKRREFEEQYDRHLADFDHQIHQLENEREILRRKIVALQNRNPQSETIEDEDSATSDTKQERSAKGAPLPTVRPDSKSSIKKHFVRACRAALTQARPDEADNEFLKMVNVAVDSSYDEAEAFISIPWDKERWIRPTPEESLGDQWERLTAWNVYLDIGLTRLENITAQFDQDDDQHTFWQEMERARAEGRNYLEELAREKRAEILRLEQAVQALREEHERLYQEAKKSVEEGGS